MIESLPIDSSSPIQLTLKTNVLSVLQEKYNAQRIVIIEWQIHANEWISKESIKQHNFHLYSIKFDISTKKNTRLECKVNSL